MYLKILRYDFFQAINDWVVEKILICNLQKFEYFPIILIQSSSSKYFLKWISAQGENMAF